MVYIASDHAGFELKKALIQHLQTSGETVEDLGAKTHDPEDDYPDYAAQLAVRVQKENARGVLLCGNAIGVSVAANKFRGVRAGIGYSEYAAKTMREDDDTNVLCLPARVLDEEETKKILDVWLATPFSKAERHVRRLKKVEKIEKQNMKRGRS